MEDLIPIAFFVFAWMMAAAGSRKKQRERQQGLPPEPRSRPEQESSAEEGAPRRGRDLIPGDLWAEIEALASGKPRVPQEEAPKPEGRVALPAPVESSRRERAPLPQRARVPEPEPAPAGPRSRSLPTPYRYPRDVEVRKTPQLPVRLEPAALARTSTDPSPPTLPESDATTSHRNKRPERTGALWDLSSPGAARRAMILKEVLGPPLAARDLADMMD